MAEAIRADHAALRRSHGVITITHLDSDAVTRLNGVTLRQGQSGVVTDGTLIELGVLDDYTDEFDALLSLQVRLEESLDSAVSLSTPTFIPCSSSTLTALHLHGQAQAQQLDQLHARLRAAHERLEQERDEWTRSREAALEEQEDRIDRKYGPHRSYGKLVEDLQALSANAIQGGGCSASVSTSTLPASSTSGPIAAAEIRERGHSPRTATTSSTSNLALSTNSATSTSTPPPQSGFTALFPTSPQIASSSSAAKSTSPLRSSAIPSSAALPSPRPASYITLAVPLALPSRSYDLALKRIRDAWIKARAAVLECSQTRLAKPRDISLEVTLARVGTALQACRSRLPITLDHLGAPAIDRAGIPDRIRLGVVHAACNALAQAATVLSLCLPPSTDKCDSSLRLLVLQLMPVHMPRPS
ncbi:hypothetical protein V8E36_000455 [Tilletia maclaganii]